MTAPRSPRSIRRFDLSKYGVLLFLAVLASILLVTRSFQEQFEKIAGAPTATVVPTFTAEAAVAAPVLISPLTGEQVSAGSVVLSGSAQAGYTVQARVDGELAGAVPVDSTGAWTLTAPVTEAGDRALDLQLVDDIGRVVASSASITIMVTMPAVTVRSPALDNRILESSFNAGVIDLAGSGEPGALVQIVVDGQVLGATRVDDDGRWSLQAEVRTPGVYAVALNALDDNGIVVATATPARLTINPALRPLAVVPPTATTLPEPTPTAAPPQLEGVTVGAAPDGALVTIRGRAAPGVRVQVANDAIGAETVIAGADGSWTASFVAPAAGDYIFSIATVDEAGVVIAGAMPIALSVLPTPAPSATETATQAPPTNTPGILPTPTVVGAATLAPDTATVMPDLATVVPSVTAVALGKRTLTGSGEPGETVQIIVDNAPVVETIVAVDGRWAVDLDVSDLPDDTPLVVQRLDAAGAVVAVEELILAEASLAAPDLTAQAATLDPPATSEATLTPLPAATAIPEPRPAATENATASATTTETETAIDTSKPPTTETVAPTDTAIVTPEPTATATDTATPQPTATETLAPTDTATVTPEPTATTTDTATPQPTATETLAPTDTATVTPEPTATATDIATPQPTHTVTPKPTATTTDTATPRPTATETLAPTDTATVTPEPTATATDTATPQPTATETAPPTDTATVTPEPTATTTDTATPQPTATETPAPAGVDAAALATLAASGGNGAVTGTGEPGARVQVRIDGDVAGETIVDAAGRWTLELNLAEPGKRTLVVETVGADSTLLTRSAPAVITIPSPTPGPTNTATALPTAADTVTHQATVTATTTSVPTATATETPEPTETASEEPTATATHTETPAPTETPTSASTSTDTATPEPTATDTAMPAPTKTATNTPVPTATETATAVPTATNSATPEPTVTPTDTAEPEATNTATPVPTATKIPAATVANPVQPTSTRSTALDLTVSATDAATATSVPADVDSMALATLGQAGRGQLSGRGEPGSRVQVLVDGEVAGATTVDAEGRWSLELDLSAAPGERSLTVQAVDAAGAVLATTAAVALLVPEPLSPPATPGATASATPTPLPTATDTDTPAPTASDTPAPTPTSTNTPRPASTHTVTPRPTATATVVPTPTETETATPRPTATNIPAPAATDTATPPSTATNTATLGPTATDTNTPRPTATNTAVPSVTSLSTVAPLTATSTPISATATATLLPTSTTKPTATNTTASVATAAATTSAAILTATETVAAVTTQVGSAPVSPDDQTLTPAAEQAGQAKPESAVTPRPETGAKAEAGVERGAAAVAATRVFTAAVAAITPAPAAVTVAVAPTALPTVIATAAANEIVTATTTSPGEIAGAPATPTVRPSDLPPTGMDLNGGAWSFVLPLLLVAGLFAPALRRHFLVRGGRRVQ